MIKCLEKSLQLDITYSINSFFYMLRKLPILKDLITEDIYGRKTAKKVVSIFIGMYHIVRNLLLKFFYFFVIFYISYSFFFDHMISAYFHIYFFLTLLGIFINNKLLNTSKKKYFSLISFNIDGTKYFRANLLWNQLSNLVLNSICIFFFGNLIYAPIRYDIMLIILSFFARFIGEVFSIYFFKKKNYIWYSNTKLYFIIVGIFLTLAFLLPILDIYISLKGIALGTLVIVIFGTISLGYLLQIKDYKWMYKKLSHMTHVMDSKNDKDYLKQAMVAVKEKDKIIDSKKLKGKKGYDLLNTIFFERHKEILIRSAKKYAFILTVIYGIIIYLVITDSHYSNQIGNFLNHKLGWFVVIMYFINRGAIITQAMFFNCDHAMLCYNFYREPKTLLGMFKKRLITVMKVNLLPAFIIGIGNAILLILCGTKSILTLITTLLFIISLSMFFSVHYLVIYYLLQPFNKDLEVKKASYSIATLITYIISYQMTNLVMDSLQLSILGLVVTIFYIIIALYLVYHYAPKTFKLN